MKLMVTNASKGETDPSAVTFVVRSVATIKVQNTLRDAEISSSPSRDCPHDAALISGPGCASFLVLGTRRWTRGRPEALVSGRRAATGRGGGARRQGGVEAGLRICAGAGRWGGGGTLAEMPFEPLDGPLRVPTAQTVPLDAGSREGEVEIRRHLLPHRPQMLLLQLRVTAAVLGLMPRLRFARRTVMRVPCPVGRQGLFGQALAALEDLQGVGILEHLPLLAARPRAASSPTGLRPA